MKSKKVVFFSQDLEDTFNQLPEKDPVRKAILERDNYKCRKPGCSKRDNIQIHEIIYRSHSGKVSLENSIVLCNSHHADVTEGRMKIERTGDNTYKFITRSIYYHKW